MFGRAARLQIAILVGKANDRIRVAHVNPLRIGSGRVEINSEWPVQTSRKDFGTFRFSFGGDAMEDADFSASAFGDKATSRAGFTIPAGSTAHLTAHVVLNLHDFNSKITIKAPTVSS